MPAEGYIWRCQGSASGEEERRKDASQETCAPRKGGFHSRGSWRQMPRMIFFFFFLQVNGVMFQRSHKVWFIISGRHFGKYRVKPGITMHFPSAQGKSGSSRKKTLVLRFIFSSLNSNRMKHTHTKN